MLELFLAFELRMGGVNSFDLIGLCDDDEEQHGHLELCARLKAFDASRAQCRLREDRDHLLAIIESSFGSLAPFNKIIHSIAIVPTHGPN